MKTAASLLAMSLAVTGYASFLEPDPLPTVEDLAPGIARMEAHAGFYGVSSSFVREDEVVGRDIMLNDGQVYAASTLIRADSIPHFAILCVSGVDGIRPIGLNYQRGDMTIAVTGQDYFDTHNPCN